MNTVHYTKHFSDGTSEDIQISFRDRASAKFFRDKLKQVEADCTMSCDSENHMSFVVSSVELDQPTKIEYLRQVS